jgi:hypothetical protein
MRSSMWRVFYFFKLFLLKSILVFFGGAIVWFFFSQKVAFLFGLCLLFFSFIFNFFLEAIIIRQHAAKRVNTLGLLHSVQWVSSQMERTPPALYWVTDPMPWVLVIRNFFDKNGSLLISQGLVNLLNEDELRAFLKQSLLRLDDAQLPLQSYCGVLLSLFLKCVPNQWVKTILRGTPAKALSPLSFLKFVFFLPLIQFLLFWCGKEKAGFSTQEQFWRSALIKIQKTRLNWGSGAYCPGCEGLLFPSRVHLDLVYLL